MTVRRPGAEVEQPFNSAYDFPCTIMGTKPYVSVKAEHSSVQFFIDTGADRTIMSRSTAESLGIQKIPGSALRVGGEGVRGSVAFKEVEVSLRFGPINRPYMPVLIGGSGMNALGQDFQQGYKFTLDEKQHLVRFFH